MQEQELQELQSLSFDNCSNEVFLSPASDHEPEIGQTLETGVMTPQVCITPVLSPTAGCGNQFFAGFPDSPKFQRKSPIKNMVRAYLPNHQTTSVSLFGYLLVRSDQVLLHAIVIPAWKSYCSKDRVFGFIHIVHMHWWRGAGFWRVCICMMCATGERVEKMPFLCV